MKLYDRITSDPEEKILELKYASKRIGELESHAVLRKSRELLLKIHIITGWTIPANELMILLVDQFSKKLSESYPMLNVDEIEYAFRQGGTVIEDWGKEMNLNLLDKVLIPYINQRLYVSAAEERKKENPEQVIYTTEQIENMQRKDIEDLYQLMRKGRIPYGIPEYVKPQLVKDGFMKQDDDLSSFFVQKLGKGISKLYARD